jgi:hypothetical protein
MDLEGLNPSIILAFVCRDCTRPQHTSGPPVSERRLAPTTFRKQVPSVTAAPACSVVTCCLQLQGRNVKKTPLPTCRECSGTLVRTRLRIGCYITKHRKLQDIHYFFIVVCHQLKKEIRKRGRRQQKGGQERKKGGMERIIK